MPLPMKDLTVMDPQDAFILAAIAASLIIAPACSATDRATGTAEARSARGGATSQAVPVALSPVVQKAVPLEIRVIGRVDATNVSVRSQVTGELATVNFKEGDDVTKGQVLFELDRRPLEAAVRQAQANLDRDIAQAENAAAQARRYEDLAKRGIATREQVDATLAASEALRATVGADRAAVETAKLQLEYATIVAPTSGRTGELVVYPGNIVRALDEKALVVINRVTPVDVVFGIPESQLPTLKKFMARGALRVDATAPEGDPVPSVGAINFIDNTVDATTGLIRIKGRFPNEDRRLWPGQFVNVAVMLTTESAIIIPSVAVQTGQDGQFVFVVKEDQTVEVRPIVVARTLTSESVIASGLKPGETVVTDGHLRLTPGSRITPKTSSEKAGL
jgi:multidrug efflux system membrane fusion protein